MKRVDAGSEEDNHNIMDFGLIEREDEPEQTPSFYVRRVNENLSNIYDERRKSYKHQSRDD